MKIVKIGSTAQNPKLDPKFERCKEKCLRSKNCKSLKFCPEDAQPCEKKDGVPSADDLDHMPASCIHYVKSCGTLKIMIYIPITIKAIYLDIKVRKI